MDYAFPIIEADELAYVIKALENRVCASGKIVAEFERLFAEYEGVKHAIGVSNGTDAIFLTMRALNVRGKKVAVPAMTFFATVEAVINAGGIPVFVDIDDTYTIDPEDLASKEFDVVMPVHLFGITANMDEISRIAEEKGAIVVEDAAQAQGSERRGKKVGSIGKAGAFSFYPTKNLYTCGRAGAITTNDDELAEKIRLLRAHGEKSKYYHVLVGRNMRMSDPEAAILKEQMKKLDERVEIRRRNAKILIEELSGVEGVTLPPEEPPHAKRSRHLFPIRVEKPEEFVEKLNRLGIPARRIYQVPIHKMEVMQRINDPDVNMRAGFIEYPDYSKVVLKKTEELSEKTVVLPVHHGLTEEDMKIIVEGVKRVLKRNFS